MNRRSETGGILVSESKHVILLVFVPYHRFSTGAMNPMNQIVQELVLKYNDPDKEDFVEAFNLLDRVSGENVRRKFSSVRV